MTLALLPQVAGVTAIEVDPNLAAQLPATVETIAPADADKLTLVQADALTVTSLPHEPTALVANLPYNVSVPVVLNFLEFFASLERVLVMVQLEVAQRLAGDAVMAGVTVGDGEEIRPGLGHGVDVAPHSVRVRGGPRREHFERDERGAARAPDQPGRPRGRASHGRGF